MNLLHFLLPALYSLPFFLTYRNLPQFAEFLIGLYIGFSLLFVDRLLHVFFIQSETEFSKTLKAAWNQKKIFEVGRILLYANKTQDRLITRSVFFLIAYVATALFVLTSTGSTIGAGVVLGIGLHYCLDFYLYRRDIELLHQHFLWQLKRPLAQREITSVFAIVLIFFLILSLLAFAGHI